MYILICFELQNSGEITHHRVNRKLSRGEIKRVIYEFEELNELHKPFAKHSPTLVRSIANITLRYAETVARAG